MKGYSIDPATGKVTFHGPGGRTPLIIPDSIPVLLIPTEQTFTAQDAVYPDVPKGRIFVHTWSVQYAAGNYFTAETGTCVVSATPQDWSTATVLATAPAGCNFFLCQARLNRTVAPSHAFGPETIAARPKANKWISLVTGSVLLEAVQSFSRALSVFVDVEPGSPTEGKLILHQQQSVADAPGGFGTFGLGEPTGVPDPAAPGSPNPRTGGETTHNGTAGYPVYQGAASSPQFKSSSGPDSAFLFSVPVRRTHRQSGSNPPSISDPTNYGATWRVDIRGRFGRIAEVP